MLKLKTARVDAFALLLVGRRTARRGLLLSVARSTRSVFFALGTVVFTLTPEYSFNGNTRSVFFALGTVVFTLAPERSFNGK